MHTTNFLSPLVSFLKGSGGDNDGGLPLTSHQPSDTSRYQKLPDSELPPQIPLCSRLCSIPTPRSILHTASFITMSACASVLYMLIAYLIPNNDLSLLPQSPLAIACAVVSIILGTLTALSIYCCISKCTHRENPSPV